MKYTPIGKSAQAGSVKLTTVLLFFALMFSAELAKNNLRVSALDGQLDSSQPPLYLPSANNVRLVTLGYNNFVSHIIWFSTQSYFGKQLRGEQDYRWLGEMCLLMAELDPSAHHAFEFCATMLSWSANDSTSSNRVLSKVIAAHPRNWYYRYLRGFNYFYFQGKLSLAKEDLSVASTLPNAPIELLSGLVSRLMVSEGDPIAAIFFLKQMVQSTDNQTIRNILAERLRQAYLTRNLKFLEQAAQRFKKSFGRFPSSSEELVESQIIQNFPPDPFGGKYIIDLQSGQITSSIGKRGLTFEPHSPDHDPLSPKSEGTS